VAWPGKVKESGELECGDLGIDCIWRGGIQLLRQDLAPSASCSQCDLLSLHVDKLNNRQLQVAAIPHHTRHLRCPEPHFPPVAWLLRFLRFGLPGSLMCNWHFSTCCGISPTTSTSHLQTLTLTCFLLISEGREAESFSCTLGKNLGIFVRIFNTSRFYEKIF